MKLMIAIPTNDYVHYAFMQCLTALARHLERERVEFSLELAGNTQVHRGREKLAKKAVAEGYSHVLWLDADMIFPETILEDLQKSGKPFVSGVYQARRPPHSSCIFLSLNPTQRADTYPDEPFRIAACGFGCVLMETWILRDVLREERRAFLPESGYGEDISFCRRASAQGIELWCDPRVVAGHIGHLAVYPESRRPWLRGEETYRRINT